MRCHDDLIGRLSTAALAAHAVGQNAHHAARNALVRKDLDLVLLVLAITSVHPCGGGKSISGSTGDHGRKL
jgi:hypothetical protein